MMIGYNKKLRYLIGKDNDFKCEKNSNRIHFIQSLNSGQVVI
jgi:hypothetical protein